VNGQLTLTPEEKGRLAHNLRGYDISPDMVRLSLVNLYLHGFADPHIYEYDTLTSEERWNEFADIQMANPPFMSPKGGIKPHKRFSIQAKRSEVLFVDYIASHLTPTGRAAIIVPEGIIFQSQGAYKTLRKMLVEEYLVAVISLPAGVFNPYSGVKTSILILDKTLARQSATIGFFKIDNDGFGLGAQRRPIEQNDLPKVKAEIMAYLQVVREKLPLNDLKPTHGLIVAKEKIAANGDYNLSGERYRENGIRSSSWPYVAVAEVFQRSDETIQPDSIEGTVTYIGLENITQNSGQITGVVITDKPADIKSLKNTFKPNEILYGKLRPNLNKVWLSDRNGICSTDILVIKPLNEFVVPALYAYVFRSGRFNDAVMTQLKGAQLPRIGWISFAEIHIPLPPVDVQKEIVAEIEDYQKVIDGARAVLDNYRPHIPIDPDWPEITIGDCCEVKGGKRLPLGEQFSNIATSHPYLRVTDFREQSIDMSNLRYISDEIHQQITHYTISSANVYISIAGTIGLMGTIPDALEGANLTENAAKLVFDPILIDKKFLCFVGNGERVQSQIRSLTHSVGVPKLALERIKTIQFPLPSIETQQQIVAEIEAEQALVAANRELITRMEKKIQAAIAGVWGEEKTV